MSSAPTPGASLAGLIVESQEVERRIIEIAELSGGEVDAYLDGYLGEINTQLEPRVDSHHFITERLELSAAMLKNQADKFNRASKALLNARERMRQRIKEAMLFVGKSEVSGTNWKYKISEIDPRIEIDAKLLPAEYTKVETMTVLDKEKINQSAKDGVTVPGVTLVPNYRLSSHVRKADK